MLQLVVFLTALVLSTLSMPFILWLSHRKGWYDSVDARKVHVGEVSRLGGLGIAFAFISAVTVLIFAPNEWRPEISLGLPIILFVLGVLIMHGMGVVDDFKNLPALFKLGLQIVAALFVACAGIQVRGFVIPFTGLWFDFGFFAIPLTVFWIISVTNAINLIDGMDALAGSTSLFAAIGFAIIHALSGNAGASILALALAGAILGFLIFNRPKAALFMGDGGAYLLGIVLAAMPLIPKDFFVIKVLPDFFLNFNFTLPGFIAVEPGVHAVDVLIGVIVLLLPISDMLAAILRRARRRIPFHVPDREHLHHKLMDFKMEIWAILGLVSLINVTFSSFAVFSVFFAINNQALLSGLFPLLAIACSICIFGIVHYKNLARKKTQIPPK